MEELVLTVLKDTPTLLIVFLVARWLGQRIDRTLDLHERMLNKLLKLVDEQSARNGG